MGTISRRTAIALLGSAVPVIRTVQAQQKELAIGMTFPVTGTLALQAGQVRDAVLFAIAGGVAVGNLYWAQPLLANIARSLGVSAATAGLLVTVVGRPQGVTSN